MKVLRTLGIVLFGIMLFVVGAGLAQEKKAAPPVAPKAVEAIPPVVTSVATFYPFPPEEKLKVRDLQFQADQLEIEIQKLQVRIEQNKYKQAEALNQIRSIAFDFATKKKIDVDKFELDLGEVRFRERQAK